MTELSPQQKREIAECRRPIAATEVPHLQALAQALREARNAAGLGQAAVAKRIGLSPRAMHRIEAGTRRTRRSTLTRIAGTLVLADPRLGPVDALLAHFVDAAGLALAPESPWAERLERRRKKRVSRRAKNESNASNDRSQ